MPCSTPGAAAFQQVCSLGAGQALLLLDPLGLLSPTAEQGALKTHECYNHQEQSECTATAASTPGSFLNHQAAAAPAQMLAF